MLVEKVNGNNKKLRRSDMLVVVAEPRRNDMLVEKENNKNNKLRRSDM
jgi:hypothetical protein